MVSVGQLRVKHPNEVRNGIVSLADVLETSETITGTPTVTATPSGLSFATVKANTAAVTVEGASVGIGKALQFSVSGGTPNTKYRCEGVITTNSSPAQTLIVEFNLMVLDA